jgi:hypothetical protein
VPITPAANASGRNIPFVGFKRAGMVIVCTYPLSAGG